MTQPLDLPQNTVHPGEELQIKHHVKEEEQKEGMFDEAKQARKMDLVELGAQMLERKNALMAEIEQQKLAAGAASARHVLRSESCCRRSRRHHTPSLGAGSTQHGVVKAPGLATSRQKN